MTDKKASLYIHIPYCISKCRYCDFFSKACGSLPVPDEYVQALCNELSRFSGTLIDTIYVGGGTPSLLKPSQISNIFDSINRFCKLSENAEITFEVNPDDVSEELLAALEAAGVNRISCGIQSMTENVLQYAGRRASAKVNEKALELLKIHWNKKLSLDVICALPFETTDSFIKTLDTVLAANPDHLSMYSLTIEDETPFGKDLAGGALSYDFEEADKMWLSGRDYLERHGFSQYEVSNFAPEQKRCRHNLVYWNHGDYFGAGSGATGTVYYKDGAGLRTTNTSDIKKYIDFWTNPNSNPAQLSQIQIQETIDTETSEFEFFMMGLRKMDGVSASSFKQIFGKPLPEYFLSLFSKWEEKGLCVRRAGNDGDEFYGMSREGILFLNRFLEELC